MFLVSIRTSHGLLNMHIKTGVFQTRNALGYIILHNYINERNEFIVVQYQVRLYNVSACKYIYNRYVNFSITKRKLTILFHFAFRGNVLGLVLIIENFATVSNKLTRNFRKP